MSKIAGSADTEEERRQRMVTMIAWAGLLSVPLVFAALIKGPSYLRLGDCEDAIKDTLAAPATYERVDFNDSGGLMRITYDAQNALGVPLRGAGWCNYSGDVPTWLETKAAL